jgi:hypothetical protein
VKNGQSKGGNMTFLDSEKKEKNETFEQYLMFKFKKELERGYNDYREGKCSVVSTWNLEQILAYKLGIEKYFWEKGK